MSPRVPPSEPPGASGPSSVRSGPEVPGVRSVRLEGRAEYNREFFLTNKDRINANRRARRATARVRRIEQEQQNAQRKRNPATRRALDARYRLAHEDAVLAMRRRTSKRYYRRHVDQRRMIRLRRRAREWGAAGHATTEQIQARVAYYGERCYLCGKPYEAIDHVIPLARGGSNWPANLRPICKPCNCRKCDRKLSER